MIIAVLLVLSACANYDVGKPFDTTYAGNIERGVTTKQDLQAHLGKPASITHQADGVVWGYYYADNGGVTGAYKAVYGGQQLSFGESKLTITFDGDIVKDYTLYEGVQRED